MQIKLWECALGDVGVAHIANGLTAHPSATSLSIADNGVTDRGAHFIATMLAKSKVPRTRTMGGTWRDQEALA